MSQVVQLKFGTSMAHVIRFQVRPLNALGNYITFPTSTSPFYKNNKIAKRQTTTQKHKHMHRHTSTHTHIHTDTNTYIVASRGPTPFLAHTY